MRKKFRLLLLTWCCALYMCGISVYAVGDETPDVAKGIVPYTMYIDDAQSRLSISSGKATVSSYVEGRSDVTKVKITAKLQKYENGKWKTIETFTKSSNGTIVTISGTYSVTKGYTYRVSNIVTAYCGSASETKTITSNQVEY